MDLYLVEEDVKYNLKEDEIVLLKSSDFFPCQKLLKFMLHCGSKTLLPALLRFFHKVVMQVIEEEDIDQLVICEKCKADKVFGYFLVDSGFQLKNSTENCNRGHHSWDKKLSKDHRRKKIVKVKANHSGPKTLIEENERINQII